MEGGEFIIEWVGRLINPTSIYDGVASVSWMIYTLITPVLLVIGIATRTMEEQLDLTNANGKWVNALRDFGIIGAVITVYFAAGNLVNDFMNAVYAFFNNVGSVGSIMSQLADTLDNLEAESEDTGLISWATAGAWHIATQLAYYASLLAVITIISFLHLAQALGYGLAFCWGLIALPMAATRKLSLLKGWGIFMAFMLVWPILESLSMGLVSSIFTGLAETLADSPAGNTQYEQGALMMAYTTLNIILVMIAVVAPFLANALTSNASAGRDFVVPFIAGALANVQAINKVNQTAHQYSKPVIQRAINAGSDGIGALKGAMRPTPTAKVSSEFKEMSGSKSSSATGAGSATPTDPTQRQARRGAIINQQKIAKSGSSE